MLSIGVVGGYRGGSDVFGHPEGVAIPAVECRGRAERGMDIVDRAWEAVLEQTVWVDGGKQPFEVAWM